MLNITRDITNQNYSELPPPSQNAIINSVQITNAGEGVEEWEPSSTISRNVSCWSHCGKQYGDSSEV